jgi:cysteine synthase A
MHGVQAAAEEPPGIALFADQFENLANFRAHLGTGAEILAQTRGRLHAFVCGAGTGGTIAGVSHALKARNPRIKALPCWPLCMRN